MKRVVVVSALGLTGALVTFVAQGCSSSASTTPGADGGPPVQDSAVTPQPDTGTGGGSDTGTGGGSDTGPGTSPDAGAFAPSNIPPGALAGIVPVAVDIGGSTFTGNCTADTTDGTFTCNQAVTPAVAGTQVTQPAAGGGNAYVWVLSSLTIETGFYLDIKGTKPGILVVLGDVSIIGALTTEAGVQSENNGPANTESGAACVPNAAAGGGGAFCGAGGSGISADGGLVGTGGVPYGTATLVPLLTGGAGGVCNGGGQGGGAIQISATGTIAIQTGGTISAGAAQGSGEYAGVGGGGGAGGAILLESPSVSIAGIIAANGAGGGDTGNDGAQANVSASAAPGGGNGGGSGAAGAVIAGGNGSAGTGGDVGAGGGGAGWIRINTKGTPTVIGGVTSPATSTTCYSVGAL